MESLKNLVNAAESHLKLALAGVIGLCAAAALAVMRHEVTGFVKWVASPITRRMPWNAPRRRGGNVAADDAAAELISELSIVELFLLDDEGRCAKYQKTSHYIVNVARLSAYDEGITTTGEALNSSTLFGTIEEIRKEHGFYVCRIDFGDVYDKGMRFTNVFRAELKNAFLDSEEHWTQEIAFPTKHLTIRVHFPPNRRVKTVRCKIVEGLASRQIKTGARLAGLIDDDCVVWEIREPKVKDIFKLEWVW
jgi:hypothetical protein